jgi:diguanylate cyclase (GGDEF)-like protein
VFADVVRRQNAISRWRRVAEREDETTEASQAYVDQRALAAVVANLAPSIPLMVPFVVLIGIVMRSQVSHTRLVAWAISAAASTALSAYATYSYRHHDWRGDIRWLTVRIGAALVAVGLVFGASPWVASGAARDVTLMFCMIPATASAVGAVITAGRRDLYWAFLFPLLGTAGLELVLSGDSQLRSVGILFGFLAMSMVLLHRVASRTALDAITLQWGTEALLRQVADDRSQLTAANDQLATGNTKLLHQAFHDPLTGLFNRRGTLDELDALLLTATIDAPVGLLFLDLDRFKAVNDALGHRGGDRFISIIADRLARSLEAGCFAGRMGGDEFVVVLPNLDQAAAMAVATRISAVLAQPVHAEGREVPSSVSIGVAAAPEHGATSSEVLRHANAALYRAKSAGRNRVELFDGTMQLELLTRLEAEQALRRALESGEILPFFQPEIDASTGQIVGAELLARWVRRDGVVSSAGEFFAIAEQAGLVERITETVMHGARPHIKRLATLGLPDGFRFRVNIAPRATERSWQSNPIDQLVAGIDPSLLTVDVRESAVTDDLPSAAANLAAFRARGGRVCLDDFARGVSSLSLLRRLPLDEVRIDRMSIDTITAHPHDRAIVRSIIALVREIGFAVTAEGVETGAQADSLIALGCVRQQGHLYAPALPAAAFESFLLDRLAERYSQVAAQQPTWETAELT